MKITLNTKVLREALARLANIPGSFGAAPYTTAVRLAADMAGLTLMRFTAEAQISVLVDDVTIFDEAGTPSVGHASLTALVSRMTDELVELSSDDKKVYLSSGRQRSSVSIFGDEAGAQPPEREMETESIRLDVEELRGFFAMVAPAMGKDAVGNNATFNGVCVRCGGEKMNFIAIDGKRCHAALTDYVLNADCVIPASGVDAILKAMAHETGACTFAIGECTATIISSNLEMSVTLFEGKFPESINKMIYKDESSLISKVQIQREELIKALEACSAVGVGLSKIVQVNCDEAYFHIAGNNETDSEMSIELPCVATEPFRIGLPSMQMANALEIMKSDSDGFIELRHYLGTIYMQQPDRIAFVALQKPL